jgi:hypothetical protein
MADGAATEVGCLDIPDCAPFMTGIRLDGMTPRRYVRAELDRQLRRVLPAGKAGSGVRDPRGKCISGWAAAEIGSQCVVGGLAWIS